VLRPLVCPTSLISVRFPREALSSIHSESPLEVYSQLRLCLYWSSDTPQAMPSSPASSSLVSPSSPLPSPFASLPTELIQVIIESTVPLHYDSETYSSRQATLRSLCLVSKLFHQIAKPLLFAVVQLRDQNQTERWEKELDGGGLRALSREIVVDPQYSIHSGPIDTILRDHFALQVLVINSYNVSVDLFTVAAISSEFLSFLSSYSHADELSIPRSFHLTPLRHRRPHFFAVSPSQSSRTQSLPGQNHRRCLRTYQLDHSSLSPSLRLLPRGWSTSRHLSYFTIPPTSTRTRVA